MILCEDGEYIKEGDEIGYYQWFFSEPDDVWFDLTAGVVVKIDDLVITFKPYKYKKEVKGRDDIHRWKKDKFDVEITFNVEKVNPAHWGPLRRINPEGVDYWKIPSDPDSESDSGSD
jgi:hypothetical protein